LNRKVYILYATNIIIAGLLGLVPRFSFEVMKMVKLEIERQEADKEPTLKLKLEKATSGNVRLKTGSWTILAINTKGQLELYGYLPRDVGLDLNEEDENKIKIAD
jgi:hypothetical protein